MIEILESRQSNVIVARISDRITKDDVDEIAVLAEKMVEDYGKVNFIGHLENLKGYTISGFIEDFKFAIKHMRNFERIAIVGEKKFEEILINLSDLMMKGEVKFFNVKDKVKAEDWIYSKELSR